MAEDDGRREGNRPVDDREVAVAQPGRRDRDEHLTRPRIADGQVVDDLGPLPVEHHASHRVPTVLSVSRRYPLGCLGRPSTRSAMIVRWIWSEPP